MAGADKQLINSVSWRERTFENWNSKWKTQKFFDEYLLNLGVWKALKNAENRDDAKPYLSRLPYAKDPMFAV